MLADMRIKPPRKEAERSTGQQHNRSAAQASSTAHGSRHVSSMGQQHTPESYGGI
jgi:hypothetical protein